MPPKNTPWHYVHNQSLLSEWRNEWLLCRRKKERYLGSLGKRWGFYKRHPYLFSRPHRCPVPIVPSAKQAKSSKRAPGAQGGELTGYAPHVCNRPAEGPDNSLEDPILCHAVWTVLGPLTLSSSLPIPLQERGYTHSMRSLLLQDLPISSSQISLLLV